jgi:type II secretory pathway component PulF
MQKFNELTKFFVLLIGTIALILIWVTSVNAQPQLTERSKLAIDGIGPIRVGMTVAEASRSAGVTLVKRYDMVRAHP